MDAEVETGQRSTVIAIKRANPALTQQQIADQAGVSRERVRQILKSAGMVTKRVYRWCANCGAPITNKQKKFCCQECREAFNEEIMLTCSYCGVEFPRRRRSVTKNEKRGYKHFFCSKQCFRKYVGEYVFPGPRPHVRVYNRGRLLEMRMSGYTLKEISEATGIDPNWACKIIKNEERKRDGTGERIQAL